MTTEAAARLYEAQHLAEMDGKGYAVFNPHNKPLSELPVIYGFNNGGSTGWYSACLLAEDGTGLGGHCCSSEGYMYHDLGILEGTRADRHEGFRKHYPDGYRMDFVPWAEVLTHPGLNAAYQRNQEKARAASVDTLPKGQDAKQGLAGTEGSAVPERQTPNTSPNIETEDHKHGRG